MAQTKLRLLNPSSELHPEFKKMARPTRASRRRAALLGIRRKRRKNPTKKGQRRKTARRAYTGLAKRRSNPRRSTRKGGRRVTARRAYMRTAAPTRRRRRRRNPSSGRKFSFNRFAKRTGELLGVAFPVLWIDNFVANWPTSKTTDPVTGVEIVNQTLSQRIGPAFPLLLHTAMLALIPNMLMRKGALAPFRGRFNDILGVLVAFDVLHLVAFSARRGWTLDETKLISGMSDTYPAWTDYLSPVTPEPMTKLAGAYNNPQHYQLRGATLQGAQFMNPQNAAIQLRSTNR